MTKPVYHKVIEEFLRNIPADVERAKANQPYLELCDLLEKEFPESYYYSWKYATQTIFAISFNFEKFSDAKRVLRFMAANKQKRTGKVTQQAESSTMIWNFERFTITGYFKGNKESSCKYVQTGTKTVEVPIYELKCEEAFDPQFKAVESVSEIDGDGLPL